MKKTLVSIISALTITALANAIVIDLTPFGPTAQPASSGDSAIDFWVSGAVINYNGSNDPDLPAPVRDFKNNQNDDNGFAGSTVFGDDMNDLSIALMGHLYVVLHWGGPSSGNTPNYQMFYVGGEDSFQATNGDQQGLSWYTLYNKTTTSVPDSGTTLALLGLAFAGLVGVRRFRR